MSMSKISIPLKTLSKSSIDLADKFFDPKLSGEWKGDLYKDQVFLSSYIQEKFTDKLHILPFVNFFMLYDYRLKQVFLDIDDRKNPKKFVQLDERESYYEKFRNTKKRFTYYDFVTNERDGDGGPFYSGHAVSCLYDKKTNTVEFFDVLGDHITEYKKVLKYLFSTIYGGKVKITYLVKRCVEISQLSFSNCPEEFYRYNSEGFCVVWTFWFLELRLSNPNISTNDLLGKAINKLKYGSKVCELVRGYAQFVDKIVGKYTIVKTSSSIILKLKDSKRPSFSKKDFGQLYVILTALIGGLGAAAILNPGIAMNQRSRIQGRRRKH